MSEVDPALLARAGDVRARLARARQADLPAAPRSRPRAVRRGARRAGASGSAARPRWSSSTATGSRRRRSTSTCAEFHGALVPALAARGIAHAPPFFVRRSRVKIMDEIARLVGAQAALFVCGERPGLGFADSLSAYYIYQPAAGATDADREVISNINPRGRAARRRRARRGRRHRAHPAREEIGRRSLQRRGERREARSAARSSRARSPCGPSPTPRPIWRAALGLPAERRALGIITATSDDALFTALDQGTKASPADVVYAKSFYAGAAHPSGPLSGECIGIYAARDPAEIDAALARLPRLPGERGLVLRRRAGRRRGAGGVLSRTSSPRSAATWRRWPTCRSAARSPT